MPKEQINFGSGQSPLLDAKPGSIGNPTVYINWLNSPDGAGHVQICFDVSLNYLRLAVETPNSDVSSQASQIWSPVLDRAEINRMIKVLRRARDGAYSRDE